VKIIDEGEYVAMIEMNKPWIFMVHALGYVRIHIFVEND
jgi:hypothetical protein